MLVDFLVKLRAWLLALFSITDHHSGVRDHCATDEDHISDSEQIVDEVTDASRTVEEIIVSRGFKAETHEVTSADGYILALNRLVHPGLAPQDIKQPVLLVHGFSAGAAAWLINSDDGYLDEQGDEQLNELLFRQSTGRKNTKKRREFDNGLGFCLAKRGYDVWLGKIFDN